MDNTAQLEYMPVRNRSVVDSVKDWILDQMITGHLGPGDKLPTETELCSNLGASRNSVREAIKQLEAYGVLHIRRAEGTFVTDRYDPKMFSPALYSIILQHSSWKDFVELRRALDIGTLYVLMGRELEGEDLNSLRRALCELEKTVSSEQPEVRAITEADCRFHKEIIRLTDNPQLETVYEYINRITVPSREKTTEAVIRAGKINAYVYLHRELYEIVERRDKAAIEQTVLNHYIFWERNDL